ncbi:biotin transporter BioY [Microbacterium sp. 18062]|uniref:biotin transporter BioY n=1 Tax=Microbacterium sp. 18062 TaxID=2681410 RepID=UPI0013578B48|nr:biotin transporter BioY [Microbacterium sp. 18062]
MVASDRFDTRDIARIAVFAAIIAALGLIGPIPVPGLVPITAQTLGVVLAGAVLGPKRGAAAVGVLLLLVFIGLPLLSGGHGGAGVFAGATGGYLIGWIAGAYVVGLIVHRGARRIVWWRVAVGGLVGGILAIYFFGIPVQSAVTGLSIPESLFTSLAFLPGDLIKVAVATVLTVTLWRAYPPAFALEDSPAPAVEPHPDREAASDRTD